MNYNKKAQLTIFVIIAILLLFSFMFVFYQISSQKDYELKKQRQENLDDNDLEVLEESIQSCLYEASVDAIELLGSQAGVYHFNQKIGEDISLNGVYSKDKFIRRNDEDFLLLIEKRDLVEYNDELLTTRQYFTPPHYPCRSKILSPLSSLNNEDILRDYPSCQTEYDVDKEIESLSHLTKLPSLCNRNIPNECTNNCICSCSGNCDDTIMSQLEDYVTQYFESCVVEQIPFDINLETKDFEIEMNLGRDNLYFELKEIKLITSDDEDIVLDNIKSDGISLNLFSFFDDSFNRMIAKESTVPSFNLTRGILDLDFVNPEVIIIPFIVTENGENKEYDLVKIKLNKIDGSLDGKPFVFSFVRENRIPVLEYVDKINIPLSAKSTFKFRAVDPDEDELRIIFSTYDHIDIISTEKDVEENTWVVEFTSNIAKFDTETIRLDVCDNIYCDYQTIELRQK
ncbi:hypothetical protein KY321_03670 [Candidatus Woesearchaeota archaeon]|nr:hypothetical protein [Candidatus Woesearchaeota archaeon]